MQKKIYVLVPDGTSGGHESLHQMVSILNDNGRDAFVFYPDQDGAGAIPEKFRSYHIKVASEIEDNEENTLVVSDLCTNYLYQYKHIQKVIWWLAWDFYEANAAWLNRGVMERLKHGELKGAAQILKRRVQGTATVFSFKEDKNEIFHFYNCEYIRNHLLSRGVREENMMYLCGPISEHYFSDHEKVVKEDIIAYNPAKGFEYTEQIINLIKKQRPEVEIVAIKGMTPNQIVDLLNRAKVYIDFGFFPGPERIPREAVTMMCNIITSTDGAAANDEDVKISKELKFDKQTADKQVIVDAILERIDHYEQHVSEYDAYREKVAKQRELLSENILKHFFK